MIDKKKSDKVAVLKGRFKAMNTNTYGLFIMFFNRGLKNAENISIVCSHFSSLYDHDPKLLWVEFEHEIFQLKWKGEISTNISHDIQQYMTSNINNDVSFEFIEAIDLKKTSKIDHTLISLLEKVLIDHNILLEIDIEDVSQEDIRKLKDERARKEKEEKEAKKREELMKDEPVKFQIEDGGVILNVELVLGPVSGIPIYELKPGDKIMLRIAGATEREKYFINLLNANIDGNILPVPAVVKEIQLNSVNEYEILTEIGPGIYGRSTESEKVKLKKYDESQDLRKLQQKQQQGETFAFTGYNQSDMVKKDDFGKTQKTYFIWILGAATLIVAIILFLLLAFNIL